MYYSEFFSDKLVNLQVKHFFRPLELGADTFERSRSLVDGGGKLSIILPDFLDGGGLEFERLPKSTTKTTKKNISRSP